MTAAKSPELWHTFAIPSPVPGDYDVIARFAERTAAFGKTQQLREASDQPLAILLPGGNVSLPYDLRSTWPALRGVLIRGRDADYVRVVLAPASNPR